MSEIKKVLEKLSLTPEQITKLESGELTTDEAVNAVRNYQRELIKSDKNFTGTIKAEAKLAELTKLDKIIKKEFGLTTEDGIDDKKTDELLLLAKEKLQKSLKEKYQDTNDSKLRKDLEAAEKFLQQRDAQIEKLEKDVIPSLEKQYQDKVRQYSEQIELQRYLEALPVQASVKDVIYPAIKQVLDTEGLVVRYQAQSKKLELLTSDGQKVTTPDTNDFINLDTFVTGKLKDWNMLKQSNAPVANNGYPYTPEPNQSNSDPSSSQRLELNKVAFSPTSTPNNGLSKTALDKIRAKNEIYAKEGSLNNLTPNK